MSTTHRAHLFKITYCLTCGYKSRALKLQSELQKEFGAEVGAETGSEIRTAIRAELDVELVQGDGGVFEVKDGSIVLFSKKEEGRFPIDGEILNILRLMKEGSSLDEAKQQAKESVPAPPTFEEWYLKKIGNDAK